MKYSILTTFLVIATISLFSQVGKDDSENKIYDKVEVEARFPGGDTAWRNFLVRNLNANTPVDHGAPAGKFTVWVQFIVDKEGNVSEIKPLTANGYGLEEEVVRIIKLVPKWTPAWQNGKYVKAYRKQPVTFVVEEDSFNVEFNNGQQQVYTAVDNFAKITADNVDPKNLVVKISQGSINGNNGNYIVRVNNAERTIITIYDKDKEIGQYSFVPVARQGTDSVKIISANEDNENYVWVKTEIEASFPGGENSWKKFLRNNLNAQVPVDNRAKDGKYTVWIQFIVDKNGIASDWKPLTHVGYGMEEEAIRVLKKAPMWVPAIQNGYQVKSYKKMPFTFVVETR